MHDLLNRKIRVSESVTPTGANGPAVMTSTGVKFIITPANPIAVQRWGFIVSVAKDASAFVATLNTSVTGNTSYTIVDTLTDSATARAQGVVLERKIKGTNPNQSTGSDGSLVNVAAQAGEGIPVFPGQDLSFLVATAAASTGQGYFYVDFIEYAAVSEFVSNTSTSLNYTVVQL